MFSKIENVKIANADENIRDILIDYFESQHDAAMNATYTTPSGPSSPIPVNSVEWELSRDAAIASVENLFRE